MSDIFPVWFHLISIRSRTLFSRCNSEHSRCLWADKNFLMNSCLRVQFVVAENLLRPELHREERSGHPQTEYASLHATHVGIWMWKNVNRKPPREVHFPRRCGWYDGLGPRRKSARNSLDCARTESENCWWRYAIVRWFNVGVMYTAHAP